jgi:hypothetical protein
VVGRRRLGSEGAEVVAMRRPARRGVISSAIALLLSFFWHGGALEAGSYQFQAGYAAREDHSSGLIGAWENNSVFFVGVGRDLARGIGVSSRIGFREGDFVHLSDGVSIPEILYTPYTGGSLRALELTVALRLAGGNPVRGAITLGGGVVVASLPEVTRYFWDMEHPESKNLETVGGTGETAVHGILGMGWEVVYPSRGRVGLGVLNRPGIVGGSIL